MRYVKLLLAGLFIWGAIYIGLKMSQLKLWGYLPLGLFGFSWAAIVCLIPGFWKSGLQRKAAFLSTVSGLLFYVAFPVVSWTPLIFIAFVPLLFIKDAIEKSGIRRKFLWHSLYTYHAFMVWNILTTFWVANTALAPALFAFGLNSLFMLVPWLGMIRIGRRFPQYSVLSLIVFWMCFEWIHMNWEISWPWLTLGNSWASFPKLIQWYELTGVFGGSLWILVLNVLIYKWLLKIDYSRLKYSLPNFKMDHFKSRLFLVIISIVVIPMLASYVRFTTYKEKGQRIDVGIVQPNYEPHYEKFMDSEEIQMVRFEKLTRAAMTPSVEFVIWPETSFGYIRTDEYATDWRIKHMRDLLTTFNRGDLIAGVSTVKFYKRDEIPGPAARSTNDKINPRFYEIQNSALQILNDKDSISIYLKSKLVPGAEIFPFKKILFFLKPIVHDLGGSVEGLGTQSERKVFFNGKYRVAPVICYESIYGNFIKGFIENGAQAIFIMTNDGWWDNTPGHIQHLLFGALRAIEFRKPIARSANTGISCVIDQKGMIHQATKYNEQASFYSPIAVNNYRTVYSYTGDLIAYLSIVATLVLIVFSYYKKLVR
ncbi:MAG: apolipoprotein N-acyltransferase [Bacteroidota bacterium]|nr:apolipoprotein N-acyltransferase [Bacteroidota bacterium]